MDRISINIYCNRPRSDFRPNYDKHGLGVYYNDLENISARKETVSKRQSSCTSFELFKKVTEHFSKQEDYSFDSKPDHKKSAYYNNRLVKTLGATIFACVCLAIFGVGIFLTIYNTKNEATLLPTIKGTEQSLNSFVILK